MKRLMQTLSLSIVLAVAVLAVAAPPEGKDAEGFEPVAGGMMTQPGESIPAVQLVAAAYGFIWLAVLVYALSIGRASQRTAQEIAELKRRLDQHLGTGA